MRLTLVISSLGAGGAERVMSTLAGEWVRIGHEVTLITLAAASTDFYALEPRVHRIALDEQRPSSGVAGAVVANFRRIVHLRHAIARSRPDAVISFMDRTNVLTLIATVGQSIRVAVSDRVDPSSCPPGRVWSVLRGLLYRRADRIVCQTRAVRDWTERATGSSRTVVIPNPVGSGFEAAGCGGRSRSILAMGRLVHQKGFDTLIAAFATIAERWPDWSLTIVGEGPERPALESMARDAGCAGRVRFAGRVNDPRPLLSAAAVFVLPSRFEGFPNALVEAMASGCAVVATDCPSGPAEIVEDGHDGILVPVDRSDRLAAALEDLLASEQRRVTLGAAARIAVRRFNLAAVAAQWMAVVEEDHAVTPWSGGANVRPVETSRLRIAILLRSLSPGGAERQAVLTARGLKAHGHDVTLLTFYGGGTFEEEARRAGIPIVELGKAGRWDLWRTWRTLVRSLMAIQADVLYAYTPTPNLLALSCKLRLPSLPVVWGIRAADMDLSRYGRVSRLVFAIGAWLSRFADAIVVNSRSGRQHHAAHGYAADRMRVIPNGIDVVRFAPDPAAGAALRRSIGVAADEVLIGMVARLDPMKDHGTFLRAASQLLAVRPDVRFVCVGDGPADSASSLRALAGELGIGDRVLWLGHRSDTPAVYNALTLLTSSSISEGFSNAIAESMACGTPVVATDAGDSAWLVGTTGLIVPVGNAERLRDAWVRMLDGRLESSRCAARDRIAAAFSVGAMVAATTETFQDVIRDTGASLDLSTISPTGR